MRKFIITAITTAALITIASGTAYAVLEQVASPAISGHHVSPHVRHDGGRGPATLVVS